MGWLKDVLTGPDNETVAIGRFLGLLAAPPLLIGVPGVACATVIFHAMPAEQWQTLLAALALYLPASAGALTGMVWGTNKTEPAAKDQANG